MSSNEKAKSLRATGSFFTQANPQVAIKPYKQIYTGLLEPEMLNRPQFLWTKSFTVVEEKLSKELLLENIGRINKKLHDDFGPYVQLLAVLEFCFIIAAIFTFALAIARGEDRGTSEGSTIGFIVATVFLIIFAIIGPFFIMHFKKKQTENALLGVQAWLETHWNPKMERHGVEWSIKTIEESGIKAPCSHVLELACYPGTLHREASDVKINTEAVDVMIDVGDTGALEIDEEDDDDDADDSDSKE